MDEKMMRKKLRRDIGSYGWALLIYYLLMNACVMGAMMIQVALTTLQMLPDGTFAVNMNEDALMNNGWGYLAACVLALMLVRLWKGKPFWKSIWKTEGDMTGRDFWMLLVIFISGQLLFQIGAMVMESILNTMGLSLMESMEMATAQTKSFSMFLYFSLGAPVVEEIVFRGLVLRGLEKYGKRFAILASALLFGIFHGNLAQSPYAFAVGLVLGYVAMEYNVVWAMVLHTVNNLLLGDTLPRLTRGLGEIGSGLVLWGIILACSVAALVILLVKRHEVAAYQKTDAIRRPCIRALLTAPGVILLTLLMLTNAISMLFL